MKVMLVSSWEESCGIAEHAYYLKTSIEQADPQISIQVESNLHPSVVLSRTDLHSYDLVWLNYQAALLSQWSSDHIQYVQAMGMKVGVTYHDTGVPNSDQCQVICAAADYFVVHEPYDDLPPNGEYLRMGVPGWELPQVYDWSPASWCGARPILGSIGFPFGHKNFTELARITGQLGWAFALFAPTASDEQVAEWTALNPHMAVRTDFVPRELVIAALAGCDATAFTYVTHGTGQSGAILQGVAARKPVIALKTCRQFRALYGDPLGASTICWCETFEDVRRALQTVPIQRVDPGIVALAEQDSWATVGKRYAEIYRSLCE